MGIGNNEKIFMSNNCKLIFHVDYNSFTYSIYNINNNCFDNIKSYKLNGDKISQNIKSIIENDGNFKKKYMKIMGSIDVGASTFIPESIFQKKDIKNYLDLTSGLIKNHNILYTKQNFTNCYSVFSINRILHELLKTSFHNITLKHTGAVFTDYALNLSTKGTNELFVMINKLDFHITFIKNKKLSFYNKFEFETENDFLYHFLNCIETLSINLVKTSINIMSNLDKKHNLFKLIEKYVQKFNLIERPTKFLYTNEILEKDSHIHNNLFNQIVCE